MKARVNCAILLRNLISLVNVDVKVDVGYSYSDRHGAPPHSIKITAPKDNIIGSSTFEQIAGNGYRFVNAKASDKGLEINFERQRV